MHRYQQLQNNCFDFVVRFLNAISYGSTTHTKDSVVSNFIARPVAVRSARLASESHRCVHVRV